MDEKVIDITVSPKRVAAYLKAKVNGLCEDGFKFFEDVPHGKVTIFDLLDAIKILDSYEDKTMQIVDDRKETEK